MQSSVKRPLGRDWKRFPLSGLFAFGAVLLASTLPFTGLLQRLEWLCRDHLQRSQSSKPISPRIILVEVRDSTLQNSWREPGVFWGTRFAQALSEIHRLGAKEIGFDFILASSPDSYVRAELSDSLSKLKLDGSEADRILTALPMSLRPNEAFVNALESLDGHITLADDPLVQSETLEQFRRDFEASVGHMAFVQLPGDADGVVRSAPLFVVNEGVATPAFAAMIAAKAKRLDPFKLKDLLKLASIQSVNKGVTSYLLRFHRGDERVGFNTFPIEQIIHHELTKAEQNLFHNSIVLVGATYSGSQDTHRTPLSADASGLSVQADALSTLLDAESPKSASLPNVILITATASLFSLVLSMRTPFFVAWGFSLFGAAIYGFVCSFVFSKNGLFLPFTYPVVGLILPILSYQVIRAIEERRFRLDVENLFGRSVTPQIRDFLLSNPGSLKLGGSRLEATALFLDMRGSTEFAESREPEFVFAELNLLYAELVPVIEKNGGLVYKFLGDGFLAVFGVPIAIENHATAAVEAALEMVATLRIFNQKRVGTEGRQWRLGCGIHTGPLAYGNLGNAERADFTVIGDTINLAARIESWNKTLGSVIAVSASTARRLPSTAAFLGPVEMEAKGREEKTLVYYLLDPTLKNESMSVESL